MYKGSFGVIRDGLTHILIPNGWSWNGPASLYCPIWVEFKEDETEDWFKTTGSLQLAKKRKLEAPYSIVHLLFIFNSLGGCFGQFIHPTPLFGSFCEKSAFLFWMVCVQFSSPPVHFIYTFIWRLTSDFILWHKFILTWYLLYMNYSTNSIFKISDLVLFCFLRV